MKPARRKQAAAKARQWKAWATVEGGHLLFHGGPVGIAGPVYPPSGRIEVLITEQLSPARRGKARGKK